MSRTKEDIWTSLPFFFAHTQGANTDQPRIIVTQEIHNAPKGVGNRDVKLVLDPEQALKLAEALISLVPLEAFEDDKCSKWMQSIIRIVKLSQLT